MALLEFTGVTPVCRILGNLNYTADSQLILERCGESSRNPRGQAGEVIEHVAFPRRGESSEFLNAVYRKYSLCLWEVEMVKNRLRNSDAVDVILYYWPSEKFI